MANTPGWQAGRGLCRDCAARFQSALQYLRTHEAAAVETSGAAILPTPVRIGALDEYRGRGVTIAFLDAGFYAHPDLVEPQDRILQYVDITNARRRREDIERPDNSSWHGMMTSVVACGNGHLSSGFYRGVASEARLVLVKVGHMSRIPHENIRRGLDWVVRNRQRYGIRIVNVSVRRRLRGVVPDGPAVPGRGPRHPQRHPGLRGRRQPGAPARAPGAPAGFGAVGADRGRAGRPEPPRVRRLRDVPLELRADRGRPAEARGHRARDLGGGADPPRHPDRGPGATALASGRSARRRAEGHHPGAPGDRLRPRRRRRPRATAHPPAHRRQAEGRTT